MRKQIFCFLFCFSHGLLFAEDGKICSAFIAKPSVGSYKLCVAWLSRDSHQSGCASALSSDRNMFRKLLRNISHGDVSSLRFSMQLFRFLDGAIKEDLAVELGKYLHRDARLVLLMFVKYDFSEEEIRSVLLNYGDAYVDDLKRIQLETKKRISLISEIDGKGMSDVKGKSLDMLVEFERKNATVMSSLGRTNR